MGGLHWDKVQRIWKDYFVDLYNMDTQEKLQFTCVALMVLGEVTILKESQLGKLN